MLCGPPKPETVEDLGCHTSCVSHFDILKKAYDNWCDLCQSPEGTWEKNTVQRFARRGFMVWCSVFRVNKTPELNPKPRNPNKIDP